MGSADVDLVHRVLVVHRVEHEREVDERVGALALEQRAGSGGVADVEALVRDLWPEARRRADVGDHDALGLVALGEAVDEARADVAGAAGDQVPHGGDPNRRAVRARPGLPAAPRGASSSARSLRRPRGARPRAPRIPGPRHPWRRLRS